MRRQAVAGTAVRRWLAVGLVLGGGVIWLAVYVLPGAAAAPAATPAAAAAGMGAPTVGQAVKVGADPLTGKRCPPAHRQFGPPGNNTSEARAGHDPLFRRVLVPGISDNDNGGAHGALTALADFNHDGRTDILVMRTNQLLLFLNRGCWRFTRHPVHITGAGENGTGATQIENEGVGLADLNGDGNIDIYITRSRVGNSLLLSQGRYDTFRDGADRMGVVNSGAYSRGVSIGDVNGDGYLDIAVGADQIGSTNFGFPYQRLYVYDPRAHGFTDVGGTRAVPGFGGAPNCNPAHDRDAPGILLRDLYGDGRLDLLQGYHDDMNMTSWTHPCNTGQRRFGIYSWRNVSTRRLTQYRQIRPGSNGLGNVGQMRYDPRTADYRTVSHGLGLPYDFAFDAFNTGRLDVLAIGPTDPDFHVNSDQIAGRFFANGGQMRFRDQTSRVGLSALNWTYKQFAKFYRSPLSPDPLVEAYCRLPFQNRRRECLSTGFAGEQQYASSILWGDFNNDGCVDFIESDRHESTTNYGLLRNTLFENDCHRHFRPVTTYGSGLDTNTETLEAADLTGDGLLDLVAGVQPSNSSAGSAPLLPADRSYTKIYMNTGALGGLRNHWLELRLSGEPQRKLTGAQLYLYGTGDHKLLGRRDLFTTDAYKTAHDLIAHWGLAKRDSVYVRVRLPGNRWRRYPISCLDHRLTIDVRSGRIAGCGRLQVKASRHTVPAGRSTDVRFTVTQPANQAIAGSRSPIAVIGARVSSGGHRARTDQHGRATLPLRASRRGRIRIRVAVPGLAPKSIALRVSG